MTAKKKGFNIKMGTIKKLAKNLIVCWKILKNKFVKSKS